MSQIDKNLYKNILEYNFSIQGVINDICQPLSQIFGVTSFCYSRFFNDGYHLSLSNDPLYQKLYMENDYIGRTSFFKPQKFHPEFNILIWPLNHQDELIVRSKSLNSVHNLNIIRYYQGTLESVFFGAPAENEYLRDFYRNNSKILENFIQYFIEKTENFIDISDRSKLGLSPALQKNCSNIGALFTSQIQNRKTLLSIRENECMRYLALGLSAKEIASILSLSPRTVEKHFENIRYKTACSNKKDLIQWFK